MYRIALDYLKEWKDRHSRKPLVIRGARQVGKSYLVRNFAQIEFENFLEINFERDCKLADLFKEESVLKIINLLELYFDQKITPGKTLVFLDEIQFAPEVFSKLRYFYEEIPNLHVISAGSLIKFILNESQFSMPVGRIEYLHLGPMTFREYLLAGGYDKLFEFIHNFKIGDEIPALIHQKLFSLYNTFVALGGMPQVIETYLSTSSIKESEIVKESIIQTFKDDFGKYGKRVNHHRLLNLFMKIPGTVGKKFKYVNIDRHDQAKEINKALSLLELAKIAYRVKHSSCNGIPLGAETDDRTFKLLFLDIGLFLNLCGLSLLDIQNAEDLMYVNSGAVAEQAVGQHLLLSQPFYKEPELYYWVREKKNSEAEVDYVISEGNRIIPIEVKSGKTGALKSLHQFVKAKGVNLAVRFHSQSFSICECVSQFSEGDQIKFKLISMPLYLAEELRRIIRQLE